MKHEKLITTPEISRRMSHVKSKRNDAEIKLAKALWHKGFRYRLNSKKLPGSPDIALTRYKIAVFIDGEFWHGKDWTIRKEKLKANSDYWIRKIEENIERDKRNDLLLVQSGWSVFHLWENEIKKDIENCVIQVENFARKSIEEGNND